MKIAIAGDHAGFPLKKYLAEHLKTMGHKVEDLGTDSADVSVDYPDFAAKVALAVTKGKAGRGIVVCGSGVGACVAANKFTGVRASVCHDTYSARQGVEHDDLNILCLGARVIGTELAREITDAFVNAVFSNEARHVRRLDKIRSFEQQ
ncbi:MAG: ribose 5-phosphate isomerase B [Elusimicrobia bacterium GWA2_56_46]|nr:MAG: ribose 5-phosphate isomerase B [Elusimicrobia bacterium GWA2_56_46]OGR54767.1 MAG: ribose 5-phosphate isomerase B [Elusimicrobia bacterium GWC2_56_31]HBB66025.1 ribose 5-phosphate isomerase B [Elusimicrobiota bacterium]HBW23443.1 ribose 5-phosphate isomerase B [Elusimicrobiota bacterium]